MSSDLEGSIYVWYHYDVELIHDKRFENICQFIS